jgi:hypothetical protein
MGREKHLNSLGTNLRFVEAVPMLFWEEENLDDDEDW